MHTITPKPFKTIEEQIIILASRNLGFYDKESAKRHLLQYGYYEIVNGYKDCLLETRNPDFFCSGSTFEHLFSLYELDKNFQQGVRDAMLEFELILKGAMSYVLSSKFGVDKKDYLKRTNYKSGKYCGYSDPNGNKVYEIDQLIKKFNKIASDDVQPFKHYRDKHGHIPLWILFKGATFGNMCKLFSLLKSDMKDEVISVMMGIPVPLVKLSIETKNLFTDLLALCNKFRNRASHSGRIFNYRAETATIRYNPTLHPLIRVSKTMHKRGFGKNDLFVLLCTLAKIQAPSPHFHLNFSLEYHLKKHLELFPDDKNFLLSEMGVPKVLMQQDIKDIFSAK
ncbi:MAG: Abi family protein [Peptostreptococcaceae bacterium]|nr:Abi family protein [Peptostreptococcaceae bacterium]